MSMLTARHFAECAREITKGQPESVTTAEDNQETDTQVGGQPQTMALQPLSSRLVFNRFMSRIMDLVNTGYPRLAFREVEDALSDRRFGLSSQQEALVLLREGLRSIGTGSAYSLVSPKELVASGAALRESFGLHAGNSNRGLASLPVYGNTYNIRALAPMPC